MHRLAWELIPSLQGVYAGHPRQYLSLAQQEANHGG